MPTHAIVHQDGPGLTLYAWPLGAAYSLADWTTHRVALTERAAPNTGIYDATLDDAKGAAWAVFQGSGQPGGFDESLASVSLSLSQASDDTPAGLLKSRVLDNGDGTKWLQYYPVVVDVETPAEPPAGWTIRYKFNAKNEQIDVEVAT